MPRVLNKHYHGNPEGSVYIGRGSPYGNPYIIGKHGNRETVIEKYRKMLMSNEKLLNLVKSELRGKDLVCYCKPEKCHGDILLEIANK